MNGFEGWLKGHVVVIQFLMDLIRQVGLLGIPLAVLVFWTKTNLSRRKLREALAIDLATTRSSFAPMLDVIDSNIKTLHQIAQSGLRNGALHLSVTQLRYSYVISGLVLEVGPLLINAVSGSQARRLIVLDDKLKLFSLAAARYHEAMAEVLERAASQSEFARADSWSLARLSTAASELTKMANYANYVWHYVTPEGMLKPTDQEESETKWKQPSERPVTGSQQDLARQLDAIELRLTLLERGQLPDLASNSD